MHTINPIFRRRRQAAVEHRRRARRERAVLGLACLVFAAIAGGGYYAFQEWRGSDIDENLVPVDTGGDLPADASVYVPTIVDLPGDPMWITLANGNSEETKKVAVAKPAGLADPAVSSRLEMVSDTMLNSSEHFMTTIPSTQQDFAFFQAQRNAPSPPSGESGAGNPAPANLPQPEAAPQSNAATDAEGGWGQTIGSGEKALPEFKKTEIENNTTVAAMVPEADRFEATEDFFVKVLADRSLASVVTDNHFPDDDAAKAEQSM
jgi:hypothetical protein